MSDTSPPAKPTPTEPEKQDSTVQLLLSMADTTWRMFTPPAIFVPGGIWADLKWHTKPWITLVSAVVGLSFSILLVKRQLRGAK
ncbi:MAG: hypothetical protein JWN01_1305 [Patescibacteria group bacterium]|nr:hypothetical protein [Patescibacteria group bacterium]